LIKMLAIILFALTVFTAIVVAKRSPTLTRDINAGKQRGSTVLDKMSFLPIIAFQQECL
jgi:hypothetical protein